MEGLEPAVQRRLVIARRCNQPPTAHLYFRSVYIHRSEVEKQIEPGSPNGIPNPHAHVWSDLIPKRGLCIEATESLRGKGFPLDGMALGWAGPALDSSSIVDAPGGKTEGVAERMPVQQELARSEPGSYVVAYVYLSVQHTAPPGGKIGASRAQIERRSEADGDVYPDPERARSGPKRDSLSMGSLYRSSEENGPNKQSEEGGEVWPIKAKWIRHGERARRKIADEEKTATGAAVSKSFTN